MLTKVLFWYGPSTIDPADPTNVVYEVEIPDGYRRVWTGPLKAGDLFLNCLAIQDGWTEWRPIAELPSEEQVRRDDVYSSAKWFGCVIRPDPLGGGEVERPCERCEVEPRWNKNRFCKACCWVVLHDGKRAEAR